MLKFYALLQLFCELH